MKPASAASTRRRALWVLTALSAAAHAVLLAPRPTVVAPAPPSSPSTVSVVRVAPGSATAPAAPVADASPAPVTVARAEAPATTHAEAPTATAPDTPTPRPTRTRTPVPTARPLPTATETAPSTLAAADRVWTETAPESHPSAPGEAPARDEAARAAPTAPPPVADAPPLPPEGAPSRARPTLLARAEAASPGATTATASAGVRIPAAAIPPTETLKYRLSRGAVSGTGELQWTLTGDSYQLRLDAKVPLFGTLLSQASQGHIDAYGLAPARHTEKRIGRSERAVNFVRRPDGQGGHIAYSMRTDTDPLSPGAQDRVSWMPQLAAVLQAWPGPGGKGHGVPTVGTVIPMDIASTSGTLRRWQFRMLDVSPEGWLHLRREPEHEHDTRSEVWIDPKNRHWPLRVIMTDGNSEALELVLRRGD